jgi:hypothetical protein
MHWIVLTHFKLRNMQSTMHCARKNVKTVSKQNYCTLLFV